MPDNDPVHPYVMELLAAAELADQPEAWAVLVTDQATGSVSVHAPYRTPMDAAVAAEQISQDVNRGVSPSEDPPWDLGWSVRLAPCTPVVGSGAH